jgi:hypothetical protein
MVPSAEATPITLTVCASQLRDWDGGAGVEGTLTGAANVAPLAAKRRRRLALQACTLQELEQ